ncbi:hypothetical protein JCM10207_002764 [Rhodosporidiobolus poonsookiae]
MDPASGKAQKNRPGRRRIACLACSSNKQKCDGATRHPCRRCELYGQNCEYPNGEIPRTAVRVTPGSQPNPPPPAPQNAVAGPSTAVAAAPRAPQPAGADDLAAAIRDMTARLAAIEAGLESDRRSGFRPAAVAASSSFAPPVSSAPTFGNAYSASGVTAHAAALEMPVETNPLQVLVSTMEQMSRDEQAMSEGEGDDLNGMESDSRSDHANLTHLEELAWKARSEPRSSKPDAFARGLVTLEDVNAAFGFYVQRIQPWIPVVEKRPALIVREKSPFFFHVILLVTNYYNTSTAARAKEVYLGLSAIVHELLSYHLLAPDPSMFSRDFIRALLLLLYYKPVQHAAYSDRLKSSSRVVHASKVNALSSLMIHALIRQAASFLGIHQAPVQLAAHLDSPPTADIPPHVREKALSDFRVWCTIIAGDTLGSLQSGRAPWTDPSSALRVVRRFAALAHDPTDVRRAATVELYGIMTVPSSVSTNPVRYRLEQLARINRDLDAWRSYWMPVLADAQNKGDPLAYTVVQTVAQFVILAVNGAVFTRWDLERKKELEEGKEGRPVLTTEDWEQLKGAADAADTGIFISSIEATASGHPLRDNRWPEAQPGKREKLHLDPRIVEDFKTALDTISCIAFAYSLLFLVRMASAGLIDCDLNPRRTEYEAGCDLSVPQPLTTGQKLPRLLELGAQLLTDISPNPDHPARRHALLIEMILRVGLDATTPQSNSHSSPAVAGARGEKRSPALAFASQPQRAATFPLPTSTTVPTLPASFTGSAAAPATALQPPQQPAGARPSVSSFESWLWDTNTPSSSALSGPLRMHDGSFVMPDLSVAAGGTGATPPNAGDTPPLPLPRPTSSNSNPGGGGPAPVPGSAAHMNAALLTAASAARKGDAAQAIASLLSEVNPFTDDMYSAQPSLGLGSHAFNDDFGLGAAGLGMEGFDWAAMAGPDGAGIEGLPEGAGWPPFGTSE